MRKETRWTWINANLSLYGSSLLFATVVRRNTLSGRHGPVVILNSSKRFAPGTRDSGPTIEGRLLRFSGWLSISSSSSDAHRLTTGKLSSLSQPPPLTLAVPDLSPLPDGLYNHSSCVSVYQACVYCLPLYHNRQSTSSEPGPAPDRPDFCTQFSTSSCTRENTEACTYPLEKSVWRADTSNWSQFCYFR